jgi:predicted naringenin-chalcone synthase
MRGYENPFYNLFNQFHGMRILQLSTALPKKEYSTKKLIETFPCKLPEDVKQNISNLGVSKRYLINQFDSPSKSENIMSEAGIVDLCAEACKKTVEKACVPMDDIGYFVAAYDVNPFLCPGLSQLLIRNVGLNPYVRHVNAQGIASTAFPKALELAENYLAAHPRDYVLLCVSGVTSYWFQNQVRGMKNVMEISQINQLRNEAERQIELRKWVATMESFLFGDGVAAAVVANEGEGLTVKKIVEVTNIGKKDYLAGYARLSVLNEPFRFGFCSHLDKKIPELGVEYTTLALRKLLGKKTGDVVRTARKWAVHTGSDKILSALAKHNGIEYEKIRESHEILREYGNLAGASLPFIIERIVSNTKLTEGDVLLMLGYGWGFSASACMLEKT